MTASGPDPSLRQWVVEGQQSLLLADGGTAPLVAVSGISVDETVLLDSAGWEPIGLVSGAAVVGFRVGTWSGFSSGHTSQPSRSLTQAQAWAVERLERACLDAGGFGVVDVTVELDIQRTLGLVQLTGTAIRPKGRPDEPTRAFSSNLSVRDFWLLRQAGWSPVSLAHGSSFARAERRAPSDVVAQKSQNLELGNFTEALAAARTRAMDNLTRSAMRPGGNGVVQVSITDERLSFAPRIVSFVAWGTTIRSVDRSARTAGAVPVVNLMDETFGVEATALSRRFRGG